MIINLELKDKWLSYAGGKPCFLLVGDNEDYSIHFDTDLNKAAVFAVFRKEGKEKRYLLDESGNVNIPLWVLKNGTFRVGLISDGFASTPLPIYVVESILDKDCAEAEEVTPTQTQQLIELVNKTIAGQHGVNIERVFIEDGELIIELSNGNKINAGKCRGSDETQFLELFKGYGESLSPSENTALIRSAIKFCADNHIETLKFPYQKTFLCEMPEGEGTLFEVPSDLTVDLNGSAVSLTANKLTGYKIFKMDYRTCKNACIKNGKVIGNKDKIYTENGVDYDYAGVKKLTKSTCEWGHGVSFGGFGNKIENLDISQCRGDGASLSGDTDNRNYLSTSFWQAGDIDSNGNYIESTSSIVTKARWRTAEYRQFCKKIAMRLDSGHTLPYLPEIKYVFYEKISDDGVTQVYNTPEPVKYIGDIGSDDCFKRISSFTAIDGQGAPIPDNATNFSVVIKTDYATDLYSDENTEGKKAVFSLLCSFAAENCVIKNCKISHCGRQGITFGLAEFCEIDGCEISDIHGVSPGAGIDVEEGKRGANHNVIRNCNIRDCDYTIIQAQGWNLLIENCVLNGWLQTVCSMRGNVIRQCTINGIARIGSDDGVDKLKPPVFEQNTVFGSLYAYNAIVKDCSIHDRVQLDGDSVAENCRLTDVKNYCGRFKNCIWEFHDSITQCDCNIDNIKVPVLELVGCKITGKNVYLRDQKLEAERIEDCEIDVKLIKFISKLFKNNTVTYNVLFNNRVAEIQCPQIIDNVFNCTLDAPGYGGSENNYKSALCLGGESVLVKGNTFNTNSATPCVYVPKDCYVVFVENKGSTKDGTVNYDIANHGTSYSTKINALVGANENLRTISIAALSEVRRFDKNANEVAYSFKDLEQRTTILEYVVQGYKNITEKLALSGSEVKPKTDEVLSPKSLIDTRSFGSTWLNGFGGNTELTDVVILDGSPYTILRSTCFAGCSNLKTFICNNELEDIRVSVFYGCSNLEFIDLKNVKTIYTQAFIGCTALKTLHLPSTLTSVDTSAFSGCTNLTDVTVDKGFSASLKLSVSTKFTAETLHAIIENLADLTGKDSQNLTLGATNIAKLDEEHKTMLTDKNWVLA